MSTYISEPGTRLAGRYRLVDQIAAGSGWTMWKAMDETLARPVTVLTFAPGFPRVAEVVTAARAASRLSDPRIAQVFEVEDASGGAYVVMEWVAGDTLGDMVASGPLDIGRACALVLDAARALAGAHGTGLAHLRLLPHSLRWTRTSGVKITGLGIDAALAGATLTSAAVDDPARADTEGLAALLYAALTGYWPGDEQTELPPAPVSDGMPCTPRQVSAEIPHDIDAVICRALLQRATRNEPPILTPATFADALTGVAPPVPLPEPAPGPWGGRAPDYRGHPTDPSHWAPPDATRGGARPAYPRRSPPAERSAAARGIISVVIVLVLAAIAATAWMISSSMHKGTSSSSSSSQSPSATASAPPSSAATILTPLSVGTYNAYKPGDNEDSAHVQLAVDGKPDTAWSTQWYGSAKLGGLKPGTGLLLDMGKQVKLSQVEVLFGPGGTDASIYLGNTNEVSTAGFATFKQVASATNVAGDYKYAISSSATGRYVLIWLTSLPPALPNSGAGPGKFVGVIYEVTVRGTPASAAG